MLEELIVAGFGGQGVLSLGMTLAYAGMVEDKEISWMPSYGPEMRGGTANCIVIVSDSAISSPIVARFDSAILLNQPSMEKFAPRVKPGGIILYDSGNIVNTGMASTDIALVGIDATHEAIRMKNPRFMNMIMLGAYLQYKPIVSIDAVMKALEKVLPEKYHHTLPANLEAIEFGASLMKQQAQIIS